MVAVATTKSAVISSEAILDKAEALWADSKQAHRDAALCVGELLADFVVARLREADKLPEAQRAARGLTREKSVVYAAERLGIKVSNANALVRAAKVVELFGDPGDMSYTTIRSFSVLVQRKPCRVARGRKAKAGVEVTPSEAEEWVIKTVSLEHDPHALYAQARKEGWDSKRARIAISEIRVRRRGGLGPRLYKDTDSGDIGGSAGGTGGHYEGQSSGCMPSLQSLGRQTCVKDLLDMVLELIGACPQADELKRMLRERIR